MKILILDGYNLLYRARTGFGKGDNPIVFNFIRSLKAIVEQFSPDQTYFVLEGSPKKRKQMMPEYKAQRKYSDHDDFYRQRKLCIEFVKNHLPIHVAKHEDHECDDVIAHLVNSQHINDECVVVSSDTDFIQLLTENSDRVALYNPVRKSFISATPYNYVHWKALVGDKSDNIEGFKKVGPKTAQKLLSDKDKLNEFLSTDDKLTKFNLNVELISFEDVNNNGIKMSVGNFASSKVKEIFETMQFDSMLNEKYWQKFERVFGNGASR